MKEEENPRNSQVPKTKGAIWLAPSGNLQGRYKIMDLNTAKKIVKWSWELIPMPDMVINWVNMLGGNQPIQLNFT